MLVETRSTRIYCKTSVRQALLSYRISFRLKFSSFLSYYNSRSFNAPVLYHTTALVESAGEVFLKVALPLVAVSDVCLRTFNGSSAVS